MDENAEWKMIDQTELDHVLIAHGDHAVGVGQQIRDDGRLAYVILFRFDVHDDDAPEGMRTIQLAVHTCDAFRMHESLALGLAEVSRLIEASSTVIEEPKMRDKDSGRY